MEKPLFTIGIPTFNRADFLRASLKSALSQSYENLQVVVSDNCSTDATKAVVAEMSDSRLKYHRNNENIGPTRNFVKTIELADGEYFSWLQDDDLIFHDFVTRAVEVLQDHDAAGYLGTAIFTESINHPHFALLYGPPVKMDWSAGIPRIVGLETIVGLSYLTSVAIPPVVAFRKNILECCVDDFLSDKYPLFAERTLLCNIAKRGKLVADPAVCGIYRSHSNQSWQLWSSEGDRLQDEWVKMATDLEGYFTGQYDAATAELKEIFSAVPQSSYDDWCKIARSSPKHLQGASQIKSLLESVLTSRGLKSSGNRTFKSQTKAIMQTITPPIVVAIMRSAKRFSRR